MDEQNSVKREPKSRKRKSVLCRVGLHRWTDVLLEGINFFAPEYPMLHLQECERCGIARRIGHTLYGDNMYYFKDLAEAKNETHKILLIEHKDGS